MVFAKCRPCGQLVVASNEEELTDALRRHAELDEASLTSLRTLFPRWVDESGICGECYAYLRQIVQEPAPAY